MNDKVEAIILAGGTSSRMRLESELPKQLQPVYKGKSLIRYQAEWLRSNGMEKIIFCSNPSTFEYLAINEPETLKLGDVSAEKEKLGTGGAIRLAMEIVSSPYVYVMNVDDIILSDFYRPQDLVDSIGRGFRGSILTSRGAFPYGIIKSRGRRIIGFDQKPLLDYKVNSGHYAFSSAYAREFPDCGNHEELVLSNSALKGELTFLDLDGSWVTINTWKELKEAVTAIDNYMNRKLYGNTRLVTGFRGYGVTY